jgi:hypothetical protein
VVVAADLGEGSGAKAHDPIDLDAPEAGESVAHASHSPPPVSDDLDPAAAKAADGIASEPSTTPSVLQLEDAGMMFLFRSGFSCTSYRACIPFAYSFRFRANFSGQDFSHLERQGSREEKFSG